MKDILAREFAADLSKIFNIFFSEDQGFTKSNYQNSQVKKNLVIASAIVVAVASSYSGLWFFKAGQYKKIIKASALERGSGYTVGEVETSGFPLSQKITIKDLKYTDKEGAIISINQMQMQAPFLSSSYQVQITDPIHFEHPKKHIDMNIMPNSDTKIEASMHDSKTLSVKYSSSGYKILDRNTNANILTLESKDSHSEIVIGEQVNNYKYQDSGTKIFDGKGNPIFISEALFLDVSTVTDENKKISVKFEVKLKNYEYYDVKSLYKIISPEAALENAQMANPNLLNVAPRTIGKNNFFTLGEMSLTPNGDKPIDIYPPEKMAKIPETNREMFRKKPAAYSVFLKLANFEVSNPSYKIDINADLNSYPEDAVPSGALNLKIDNFDNLAAATYVEIQKYANLHPGKFGDQKDTLKIFNKSVSILKGLAAKNILSKDGVPIFEITRKRNDGLNIKINDVTVIEIMMQFMQPDQQVAVVKP